MLARENAHQVLKLPRLLRLECLARGSLLIQQTSHLLMVLHHEALPLIGLPLLKRSHLLTAAE